MTVKHAFQKWEEELSGLLGKQLSPHERRVAISAWSAAIRYADNEACKIMVEEMTKWED